MQTARKLESYLPEPTDIQHRSSKRYRRIRRRQRRLPDTLLVCSAVVVVVCLAVLYLGQQVATMHLNVQAQRLEQHLQAETQKHEQLLVHLNAAQSLRYIEELARQEIGMVESEALTVLYLDVPVNAPTAMAVVDDGMDSEAPDGVFVGLTEFLSHLLSLGGVKAGWSGQ